MEHIPGYDRWKTTPPEDEEPKLYCSECRAPIYEGDVYLNIDTQNLCKDCFEEYKKFA